MDKLNIKIISSKEAFLLKEELWAVYNNYFEFPKEKFFDRIQNTPRYALYQSNGILVGFTGIYINEMIINNQKVLFLGLGSSVISPEYRGKYLLQKTCLKLRWNAFLKNPFQKFFFWCHASSYKTYCILANFRTHYPAYNTSVPAEYKTVIDDIGVSVFGNSYNESTGTAIYIGLENKDKGNHITKKHLDDPVIQFYHKKIELQNAVNEGVNGLITIAPMNLSNVYGWFIDLVQGRKRKRI
jgi:hypothetical protein